MPSEELTKKFEQECSRKIKGTLEDFHKVFLRDFKTNADDCLERRELREDILDCVSVLRTDLLKGSRYLEQCVEGSSNERSPL